MIGRKRLPSRVGADKAVHPQWYSHLSFIARAEVLSLVNLPALLEAVVENRAYIVVWQLQS
jgi:hypothetical protein